jgi:hypothetical protein
MISETDKVINKVSDFLSINIEANTDKETNRNKGGKPFLKSFSKIINNRKITQTVKSVTPKALVPIMKKGLESVRGMNEYSIEYPNMKKEIRYKMDKKFERTREYMIKVWGKKI